MLPFGGNAQAGMIYQVMVRRQSGARWEPFETLTSDPFAAMRLIQQANQRHAEVTVLPAGVRTRVAAIDSFDGPLDAAFPTMSVTLRLADEIDVSRGNMIVGAEDHPLVARGLDAMICWMGGRAMTPGARYAIEQTTRAAEAAVALVCAENRAREARVDGRHVEQRGPGARERRTSR